ncbi:hypothetical protein predicted by Glimmer/Critica [Sorangium cellulosum So ce56]|uniref:EamA domain-containing protein n=1 Tax=Sorangium cellulosum (strain So ce56) TaxID=448385 RepID=A9G0S8_SORC5|nr:EamA family transporter [Sorangium cellulosum]CAN92432.1 hypothetical protein predicted by Glimmer/Critica [Sorangium cellulosum So ce56]
MRSKQVAGLIRWPSLAIAKLASVSSIREHETIKGLVAVIAAASAWGTVPLFVKHAERSAALSPSFESFALMAGMTLASAPLALGAGKAATLTLLEPLVAIALSLALLGERPTGTALAGGLLILASAAAVLLEPPAPPAQNTEIVADREIRS